MNLFEGLGKKPHLDVVPLVYGDPSGHFPILALVLLFVMVGTEVGVINYTHTSDLNLEANPVSSIEGLPNVVVEAASASAGLGVSTEVGASSIYHVGSDTYATCVNTCSDFTSEILGGTGSVSFAWTDAKTAVEVAEGFTTSVSLGAGPVSVGKWNTASENSSWHPPLAKPQGTTGFTLSSGKGVTPVNITYSTCFCTVISQGKFSEGIIPIEITLYNKLYDLME